MIISSCGGGNSVSKNSFDVGALISKEHPISNDERNIATRICYAYQSKSTSFRSSGFLGTKFIFSGKNTDCQNAITTYQISTTLKYDNNNNNNNDLIYATLSSLDPNSRFSKQVQTDRSGYLSQLCSKIISNQEISNTIDQTSVKVQISFFHDGFDGFQLQYFIKQSDNTYKIDSAEKFKVLSMINFTTGKILGMDQSYVTQKICSGSLDKNKFSEFEQNFISH